MTDTIMNIHNFTAYIQYIKNLKHYILKLTCYSYRKVVLNVRNDVNRVTTNAKLPSGTFSKATGQFWLPSYASHTSDTSRTEHQSGKGTSLRVVNPNLGEEEVVEGRGWYHSNERW